MADDLKADVVQASCLSKMESSYSHEGNGNAEKCTTDGKSTSRDNLRLAVDGLPLVPQPSHFKDDPLVRNPFPTTISLSILSRYIPHSRAGSTV
jgi:hypothetical protein